ncbi:MLO-like protein 9 [Cryptomeria japonica]|uniref:MLO-like protein 9 n=1 Tax=Cryptomeria japonica TaxID=3369 RepID=UPI0027DA0CCC|nr:MLO-like protein 9 [Cryptomeria japonica]
MALDIQDRNPVVRGAPVVNPNDQLFWFKRPRLILHLIHFSLYQSAFHLAFFFWAWYEYGLESCFHKQIANIVVRVSLGVTVQILCSYVTLPLYALVTQMGTNMKTTIFGERIASSLKKWHQRAKRNLEERQENVSKWTNKFTRRIFSSSSFPQLQKCKRPRKLGAKGTI